MRITLGVLENAHPAPLVSLRCLSPDSTPHTPNETCKGTSHRKVLFRVYQWEVRAEESLYISYEFKKRPGPVLHQRASDGEGDESILCVGHSPRYRDARALLKPWRRWCQCSHVY